MEHDQESTGHIMGSLSKQVRGDFQEVMPELGFKGQQGVSKIKRYLEDSQV